MKKQLLLIISLLFLVIGQAFPQEITFDVSGNHNVVVGEQFIVRYTTDAINGKFNSPNLKDFKLLSGPNTSTSSSFQSINGRVTQSQTTTYTFYLRAIKEGTLKIPPATIELSGKKYKSKPFSIIVGKQKSKSSSGSNNSNQVQNNQTINKEDVFLKAELNKKSPYLGEQIIVSYKLYTRIQIGQLSINNRPAFQGFWLKNLLNERENYLQSREVINGQEYISIEISKQALFPQKSGEIIIEPLEIECIAQIKQARSRRSAFDSFFNDPFFGGYKNIQIQLKSEKIKIKVKPLPAANKPLSFNGAVGNFKFIASVDKLKLQTNDASNLKLKISGKGNLELIDNFKINFPPDFEVYDPKISDKISTNRNIGISGSRTFEYLMIPRNPGEFIIKAPEFTYFDPVKADYKTIKSKDFIFIIEKSADYQTGNLTYSGINKEDIQYIGTDIRHIKTSDYKFTAVSYLLFGSVKFILWIIIPLLIFIIGLTIWKKQEKKRNNLHLMRHRKATKVARKNLKKAQSFLGTEANNEFYTEISQALWGYLSDKFGILLSQLSKESVHNALINENISENTIQEFIETLDHCDFARFAPGNPTSTMETIYNEALEIISKIERELK